MEILKNILIITNIIFLLSCKYSNEQIESKKIESEKVNVDLDNLDKVQMSSFIEEIEYIPLKTDGIPLGRSSFYSICDNKFYYLDKYQSKKLCIFDLNGKLKFSLDKNGRGPGEYLSINDFFINYKSGNIEILDNRKKKIHYYDSLGNFIRSKTSPRIALDFIKYDSNYYFWAGNLGYANKIGHSLQISDLELDKLKVKFPISDEMNNVAIGDRRNFHEYNNDLFLSHQLNDTIYKVSPYEVTAEYVINFGAYKLPEEIFQKKNPYVLDFVKEIQDKNLTMGLKSSLQNDKYLYFNFSWGKVKDFHGFYDKENKEVFYSDKIENDIDQGIFGIPFHLTNEHLYMLIQPYKLLQKLKKEKPAIKKQSNLGKLLSRVDENSNPVLMVCKLKK
jgi:hypothetical protein